MAGVLSRILLLLRAMVLSAGHDVVYARTHPFLWPLAVWCSYRRTPLVLEVNGPFHDTYLAYPKARRFRRLIDGLARDSFRRASGVVAVTAPLAEWVRSLVSPRVPVEVITNGASLPRATFAVPAVDRPVGPYVIFFGTLARWQGVACMLAATRSPGWPPDVELLVVGEGACAAELLDAGRRVTYIGAVEPPVLRWLASGAIGSLSVQDEAGGRTSYGIAPLKVFESLALGVPVVVSDWPGQGDIVRAHNCGLVVTPGDAEGVARAVGRLVSDPVSRSAMSQNALTAAAHHSWAARADATAQFLSLVLAKSQRNDRNG